jgi:hypothetical protein
MQRCRPMPWPPPIARRAWRTSPPLQKRRQCPLCLARTLRPMLDRSRSIHRKAWRTIRTASSLFARMSAAASLSRSLDKSWATILVWSRSSPPTRLRPNAWRDARPLRVDTSIAVRSCLPERRDAVRTGGASSLTSASPRTIASGLSIHDDVATAPGTIRAPSSLLTVVWRPSMKAQPRIAPGTCAPASVAPCPPARPRTGNAPPRQYQEPPG